MTKEKLLEEFQQLGEEGLKVARIINENPVIKDTNQDAVAFGCLFIAASIHKNMGLSYKEQEMLFRLVDGLCNVIHEGKE